MRLGYFALVFIVCIVIGAIVGYQLAKLPIALPDDFKEELRRFSFINLATGEELTKYKVIGKTQMRLNGYLVESYIVGFEDRYGRPEADYDWLDTIVEMKRVKGSGRMTIRIVQLSLDTVEVYFEGELVARIRPSVEMEVKTR